MSFDLSNFSSSHQEVFFHILSYLQRRDLQRLSQTCTSLGQSAYDELLARCCSCFAHKFSFGDNRAEKDNQSADMLQRKAKAIRYLKGKIGKRIWIQA